MSWNHRIVKYADGSGYGLHEVHYDNEGEAIKMAHNPTTFCAGTAAEVVESITMAKVDATKRPVFEQPEEWAKKQEEL